MRCENQREKETLPLFRMNTVSSFWWQLPHFSNTNGCQCWTACIRSLAVGPITAPLSLSFITQFVCSLIRGLAPPAHPSTRTVPHMHTHKHTHLQPDCQHPLLLGIRHILAVLTFAFTLNRLVATSVLCPNGIHLHEWIKYSVPLTSVFCSITLSLSPGPRLSSAPCSPSRYITPTCS